MEAYLSLMVTFLVRSLRVIMTSSRGWDLSNPLRVRDGEDILSPFIMDQLLAC